MRARKRRQTRDHIIAVAITLFHQKGYDGATIDEIAEQAGISRRSFFNYFQSKDDILLALQAGTGALLAEAVLAAPKGEPPFVLVRKAVMQVAGAYSANEMLALDKLMRASPAVQARKPAFYADHERALFDALAMRWPEPEKQAGLRLLALLAIGAVRLSLETFGAEGGRRSLSALLDEAFDGISATF